MVVLMVLVHDKRPGPGFHHLLNIALLIAVASLLDSCRSAPAPEPWWYNPCTEIPKTRHSRSTTDALSVVKNQLRIFTVRLHESTKKIRHLYKIKEGKGKGTPSSKLPWLKIKKMTNLINQKPLEERLIPFHESLQHFAGTLEVLRNIQIEQNIDSGFDQNQRNIIFENVTNQMKSLLCEVQYAINSTSSLKKVPLSEKIPKALKKLNLTSGQITDINFFSRTRTFFKRVQRLLFKKRSNKKTQKATSDRKRKTKT